MIGSLEIGNGGKAIEELREAQRASEKAHEGSNEDEHELHSCQNPDDSTCAYDDVTGAPLEVERVIQARKEEIEYFKKMR
eukprot:6756437-Karenia_brevis.AAC.1